MNFWALLYRAASIMVAVLLAVGVVCVFLPKCRQAHELQRQRLALAESNARVEAKIRQLEQNQQRFKTDPEFVERVAREQGMAKPGETIFRFVEETNTARQVSP